MFGQYWEGDCTKMISTALRTSKPDIIFHLAGAASVPKSVENPLSDFEGSVNGTAALAAELLVADKKPTVIFFSSAAVYGEPVKLPITEDSKIAPISPYGVHKAVAEDLLGHYGRIGNFAVAALRIFSAYGPGLQKQIFWDLGVRALAALQKGQTEVQVFGTGRETRDFVHAREIVRVACKAAAIPLKPGISAFNVASGVETSVARAATIFLSSFDPRLKPVFTLESRQGDPSRWLADVSRLRDLGLVPIADLSAGLAESAKWIVDNFSTGSQSCSRE